MRSGRRPAAGPNERCAPGGPLGNAAHFGVRLTPRGGSDRVDGVRDGVLRVRVAAAPVDGAANAALIRLLAGELDVPSGAVRIAGSEAGRTKRIVVDGLSRERLVARWPGLTV